MNKFKPFLFLIILNLWIINGSAAGGNSEGREIIIQKIGNGITLGLVITDLNENDKKELEVSDGAKVMHVLEDSQAEKAGFKENDVIVGFEGEKIDGAEELNDIVEAIEGEKNVSLSIIRDGSKKNIKATIKPHEKGKHYSLKIIGEGDGNMWTWETSENGGEDGGEHKVMIKEFVETPGGHSFSFGMGGNSKGGFLGVMTDNISKQMLEYFEVDHGVLIKEIVNSSPAKRAGLKAGDIITFIEDRKIEDYSDLTRTISFYNPGEEVEIDFVRKGSKKSVDVKLAKKKHNKGFIHEKSGNSFFFDTDDHVFSLPWFKESKKIMGKPFIFKKFGSGDHRMNIYII